ncbi:Putative peroxiredoxin bcp [Candidatus Bealeia paramacronuclearis]|uniref:thioredoxin-dependent peroxiredoxin n=1 Tax=Candidatus Bealeia paramacronuclearis TaxID=1921001 RepID=A0ABZ2C2Q6_9PROT|nr:putative peroxiredoxin bcp [Candidatus Bealeia paramacronuclearis]
MLEIGNPAPDFILDTDTQGTITLSNLKGKRVVVYFYPKDMTPGCTQEACDFRDHYSQLEDNHTVIIGISKDSLKSHSKFREKENLNFILASDPEGATCEAYGVWVEKSMYGKKYFGIERATFLIDENGFLQKIWRSVKVKGHVDEVLKSIKG